MNIATLIIEEAARFECAFGIKPECVFIGAKQQAEIDAVLQDMRSLGLLVTSAPIPRGRVNGMDIFRVDADSHLSFGPRQPSPCG